MQRIGPATLVFLLLAAAAAVFQPGAAGVGPTAGSAPSVVLAAAVPPTDTCTSCHENLGGALAKPAAGMGSDVHAQQGLRCASCHGGNPARTGMDAHDRAAGFVGAPTAQQTPQFCARCHSNVDFMRRFNPRLPTDQFARYQTSVHGKRLKDGDQAVATCTSCHGVHPVRSVTDSSSPVFSTNVPATCARCHADPVRMKKYGIPTTQYAQYKESVHGQALLARGNRQAPACNDCHDNHGATPPGVTSVANVCAQCHSATRDLFVRSPHKTAFDALGIAECTVCHGTHRIKLPTDAMIGARAGAVCMQCHPTGSAGLAAAATMRGSLENLKTAIAQANKELGQAADAGMDVSEARLDLDQASTQLILTRAATHAADPKAVQQSSGVGVAAAGKARAVGAAALAEVAFRRRGLGVSIAIIALVAVLLWLKFQQIRTLRGGGDSR
ncbi:MAG TPA: cytochrome c3 family protein [bacterium]|jgi:predicted CXXCH cytochrome family protein